MCEQRPLRDLFADARAAEEAGFAIPGMVDAGYDHVSLCRTGRSPKGGI